MNILSLSVYLPSISIHPSTYLPINDPTYSHTLINMLFPILLSFLSIFLPFSLPFFLLPFLSTFLSFSDWLVSLYSTLPQTGSKERCDVYLIFYLISLPFTKYPPVLCLMLCFAWFALTSHFTFLILLYLFLYYYYFLFLFFYLRS